MESELFQLRLVLFDSQQIIRLAITNRLGDGRLRAHGINGDNTAFQCQGGQQFWYRSFLIRLGRSGLLTENQYFRAH